MRIFFSIILAAFMAAVSIHCGKKEPEKPVKTGTAEKGETGYAFQLSAEDLSLNWKIEKGNLKIKLRANTKGWLGIGFNPTEEMKDANFIIGFVKDGAAVITDEFGISKRQHMKDTAIGGSDDVLSPAGSEKGDTTEVSFMIPMQSKDAKDGNIDPAKLVPVVLAYGESDNTNQHHKLRSKFNINFSTGSYELYFIRKGH